MEIDIAFPINNGGGADPTVAKVSEYINCTLKKSYILHSQFSIFVQ